MTLQEFRNQMPITEECIYFQTGTASPTPGEVLDAVDRVTNQTITRRLEPRRAGDPAELVSDPSRIRETLPWQPRHADLEQIIAHALQWERKLSDLRGE